MTQRESEIFKLLSSDVRRRILAELDIQSRYVGELAGILNMERPKLSHQLKPLLDARLIYLKNEDEPDEFGKKHFYALEPQVKKCFKKIIELATQMCM